MSRCFFFGLIEVKEWPYLWGWSAAQVQLMSIDQPVTVYKRDKDGKREETMQEKKAKMSKIVADWKKKKAEGKGMKLSDFLGAGARKFDSNNTVKQ